MNTGRIKAEAGARCSSHGAFEKRTAAPHDAFRSVCRQMHPSWPSQAALAGEWPTSRVNDVFGNYLKTVRSNAAEPGGPDDEVSGRGAGEGTHDRVTGIVHARVHPRIGDRGCERSEWQGEHRQLEAHGGREGER